MRQTAGRSEPRVRPRPVRPKLDRQLDADVFANYYWLKAELIDFCRRHGLPRGGGKLELSARIQSYLKGEINPGVSTKPAAPRKKRSSPNTSARKPVSKGTQAELAAAGPIALEDAIPASYRSDERHRAFFQSVIGKRFRFNVPFMNWMKQNAGKTYRAAVQEWQRLESLRKQGKQPAIAPQFEYNQYTRDFFAANPGASREEALRCWQHKRSLPGHNRYEDEDRRILQDT